MLTHCPKCDILLTKKLGSIYSHLQLKLFSRCIDCLTASLWHGLPETVTEVVERSQNITGDVPENGFKHLRGSHRSHSIVHEFWDAMERCNPIRVTNTQDAVFDSFQFRFVFPIGLQPGNKFPTIVRRLSLVARRDYYNRPVGGHVFCCGVKRPKTDIDAVCGSSAPDRFCESLACSLITSIEYRQLRQLRFGRLRCSRYMRLQAL